MHRLPLQLQTASISWNRNLPESTLFERTLNKRNVEENEKFLTALDTETDAYFKYMYNYVADQFLTVPHLLNSKDDGKIKEGMRLLDKIILRAPRDSPVLPIALKMRGNCSFQKCCFEAASMDYEMFLYIGSQTNDIEELCEVNGHLVICYYLRRQYEKSKERLMVYYKYKALLPEECIQKPHLDRMSRHVANFAGELDHIDDLVPKFREDVHFCIPYKGFNVSKYIPLSSVACSYVSKQKNSNGGVYANCTIPAGSIVLVEYPIAQSVDQPFVQCEQCLQKKQQVYSCLNCRYKTYCSLRCMQKDEEKHQDECVGYKYLILLLLDARNLYRIFMSISNLLNEKVFGLKNFRKLSTACAVWEKLQSVGDGSINGMQYLQLLNIKPDYSKLSPMQYSTLVMTAFRLTMFIEKKTFVMESLYGKLRLSNKQIMIIMGAILMRINCHLMNNSFDFELSCKLSERKSRNQTVQQQVEALATGLSPSDYNLIGNPCNHYNIDVKKEVMNKLLELLNTHLNAKKDATCPLFGEPTQSCNDIKRYSSTYKEKIVELYFNPNTKGFVFDSDAEAVAGTMPSASLISSHINTMCDIERYVFVQTFVRQFHMHFVEYFLPSNLCNQRREQVVTVVCTTLSKYQHSCAPNVEVVIMENGMVIAKTLQEIKEGEELFVSFKAHYMLHTLSERKKFLQKLNLECTCKYCQMDEENDICNRRLAIYCDTCQSVEITPAQKNCVNCQVSYRDLLIRYKSEAKLIAKEIQRQQATQESERDLVVLYLMSYQHASRCFVPCNEIRIRIELEYARFLALKNFAGEAYNIIVDVKKKLAHSYQENFIWFSLYADILNILKVILYYNLDKDLHSVSISSLEFLCKLGLHIIHGQLGHTHLYEIFDYECASILDDLHIFLKWKDHISCMEFLPLLSTISRKTKDTKGKHNKNKSKSGDNEQKMKSDLADSDKKIKSDFDFMPTLSEVKG